MDDVPSRPQRTSGTDTVSRRAFLGGVTTVAIAGTAGCSDVINAVADFVLKDVNVFNETDRHVRGSIVVRNPHGDRVLDGTFDLTSKPRETPNGGQLATFGDVWQTDGVYDVMVELATGLGNRDKTRATFDATITDPDEEMLGIALGADEAEDGIVFTVAKEFTEFGS